MALKTRENTVGEVSAQIPPMFKERCDVRIKDATFDMSKSSGNPMITWDCEIVAPLEYKVGQVTYKDLERLRIKYYLPLTDKMLPQVLEAMEKLGLPPQIDDEQPDVEQFKGLVFSTILSSKEKVAKKPDPEKPGEYITMTDGRGQPIKQGWELVVSLRDILGLAEASAETASRPV